MRATTTLDGGVGVPVHTLAGVGMERGDHREDVLLGLSRVFLLKLIAFVVAFCQPQKV